MLLTDDPWKLAKSLTYDEKVTVCRGYIINERKIWVEDKERELRNKHPSLGDAWAQYRIMLSLVEKQDNET